MDKEVLIKFIDMIQSILSRINSKRIIVLFGFLYWLYAVKDTIGATWAASTGSGLAFIVVSSFIEEAYKRQGTDNLDGTK